MATIAVVTEVPADGDMGNLALAPVWVEIEQPGESNDYRGRYEPGVMQLGAAALMLRAPVFALGEILVLDEDGREVGGHRRKPSKWSVGITECPSLEDAIALSQGLD